MVKKSVEEEDTEGEEEEQPKKPEGKWIVQEIPTATEPMVVNTKTKTAYSMQVALAEILNNQEKLMKLLD